MNQPRKPQGAPGSTGGQFAIKDRTQTELNDRRGLLLSWVRGTPKIIRGHCTATMLDLMRQQGTLPRYVQELKDDFEEVISISRAFYGPEEREVFTEIDVRDFLLRLIEDDAAGSPQFLELEQTGEDTRITKYVNIAVEVTNASDEHEVVSLLRAGWN